MCVFVITKWDTRILFVTDVETFLSGWSFEKIVPVIYTFEFPFGA
jgi:hypothetical protein